MKEKILVAHQPDFLPYELFWRKISKGELFILCDSYVTSNSKNSFQNRQQILGCDREPKYIKIPAKMGNDKFNETEILENVKQYKGLSWRETHLLLFRLAYDNENKLKPSDNLSDLANGLEKRRRKGNNQNIKSAEFIEQYYPEIEKIYLGNQRTISEFNGQLITYLMEKFDIHTPLIYLSSLNVDTSEFSELEKEIRIKGAKNSETEIKKIIESVRDTYSNHNYSLSIDNAAQKISEELISLEKGELTSFNQRKEYKIDATMNLIKMLLEASRVTNENYSTFLSGSGSEVYIVKSLFDGFDLKNTFYKGKLKEYTQVGSPDNFVPYMCTPDILFNVGGLN